MSGVNSVNISAAAAAFDRIAGSYDDLFTHTSIGRAQRRQVWRKLLKAFEPGARILELNCGTGEDARFLDRKGRSVLACDASSVMIEVAKERSRFEECGAGVEYRQIANEDLSQLWDQGPFDGAFSNFAGLNCMADLQPVARDIATMVRPGGKVLICLWSRICLTELVWFLLHGQISKAFRRFSGEAEARIGGLTIKVSYPTVRAVRHAFSPWFHMEARTSIGLFVPPSYVEQWIREHEKIFTRLEQLDHIASGWPMFRDVGDHTLLEFVRCGP